LIRKFLNGGVAVKHVVLALSFVATVLIGASGVYAQSDPLAGTWGISASGQAALGGPTRGTCNVSGTVPAALYDALIQFSHGNMIIHALGINIGATNCSSSNFQGSGTYSVVDKGKGGFEANGTFTPEFAGRGAACAATTLDDIAFTVIGKTSDSTFTITINGLGSGSYTEGPPPGPTICSAPILNLTANGAGKKL